MGNERLRRSVKDDYLSFIESQSGMVLCWLMNKGSGKRVADLSGFGNHGTISGATWQDTKTGLYFDNVDDYVEKASNGLLNIGGDISFGCWAKQITGGDGAIIVKADPGGGNRQYALYNSATETKAYFSTDGSYSAGYALANAYDISTSKFEHLFIVKKGVKFYLYINGENKQSQNAPATTHKSATAFRIGDWADASGPFGGYIPEVLIFNRALSNNEIKALYDRGHDYYN